MLIDSHCHLDYAPIADDLPGHLSRARDAGVGLMLTISTKLSEWHKVMSVAENNPNVYCTIGIHPHHAASEVMWPLDKIYEQCRNAKVAGIGEAGLDYYYDYAPKNVQADVFRAHIAIARHTQLPLVIHTRDADDDTRAILEQETAKGKFPFLLHCFTGGEQLAQAGIALGGYVSFSGILTYKNAENLRKIASSLPSDRILVETDAPYLAPDPHRGKPNEPAFVRYTAKELARLRGVSFDEIAAITTDNFYRLFSKTIPARL